MNTQYVRRQIWIPLAALALMALGSMGCITEKRPGAKLAVSSSASTLTGVGGLEGFRVTVYNFARNNCASCHGKNQVPTFATSDLNASYSIALGLVNFLEIPSSKFVKKVKDAHCGGACATDGSAMIQMITDWKSAYDSAKEGPAPGTVIPKGNIFTIDLPVPKPSPMSCKLPDDLRCSPDVTSSNEVACANKCWTKLRYPLKSMSPAPAAELSRAWFEVDFAYGSYATDLGVASYVIRNPRIVSPDQPIYVHDIKTFINGTYHPEYGEAFRMVDTVVDVAKFGTGCTVPAAPTPFDPASIGASCVPSVQPLFSTAASSAGIVQQGDPMTNPDKISFSFEYLQKGIVGDCKDVSMFTSQVFNPIKIGAVACLNCHKSGGQISEAGQRFNMDPDDVNNGATASDRMNTICRRFLQRSNFTLPDSSPIIVQPRQGLNGMPAQDNFSYFAPDWISWIEREADLAK